MLAPVSAAFRFDAWIGWQIFLSGISFLTQQRVHVIRFGPVSTRNDIIKIEKYWNNLRDDL